MSSAIVFIVWVGYKGAIPVVFTAQLPHHATERKDGTED